jgi:carboxylesterase type B
MLLASPAAKGLFHSAVIESGPGIKVEERESATKAAEALLRNLQSQRKTLMRYINCQQKRFFPPILQPLQS